MVQYSYPWQSLNNLTVTPATSTFNELIMGDSHILTGLPLITVNSG